MKGLEVLRQHLATARKEKGYTQKEIAAKLGVSERHYRMIEAGTSNGTIPLWQLLVKLLDAPNIDFLLEQKADNERRNNHE